MAAFMQKCMRITTYTRFLNGVDKTALREGHNLSRYQMVCASTVSWNRSNYAQKDQQTTSFQRWSTAFSRTYPGTFGVLGARFNTHKLADISKSANDVRFKSSLTNSSEPTRSPPTTSSQTPEGGPEPFAQQETSSETFDNYQVTYGAKSTFELLRVLTFFSLCRFSFFTDNAVKIMAACYKALGKRAAEWLIRKSAYDQFVAGQGSDEVKKVAAKLRQGGVATILCVPIETDLQVTNSPSEREAFLNSNLEQIVASIELCAQLGDTYPMTQFRVSALLAGDLTKTVSPFCAKTTHDSQILDALSVAMCGSQVEFCQLLGWSDFPPDRNREFLAGLQRLGKVKDALAGKDVIVLIDAELTSINPALRLLTLCLMKACNTEYAKIFYTYQAYLKTTRTFLEQDLAFASANGFGFGLKLVRGAYMVTERQLARELGRESQVYETFELTSANYHSCLDLLMAQVASRPPNSVRFMIASHNEDTMRHAMTRMATLGIARGGSSVFFGQLYGMADHVSFTMGRHGYRVYKSVPFGPVQETLPYLARRAQENRAILAGARRERKLVAKALTNRLLFRS